MTTMNPDGFVIRIQSLWSLFKAIEALGVDIDDKEARGYSIERLAQMGYEITTEVYAKLEREHPEYVRD